MKKTRSRSTNSKHHKSVDSAMLLEVPFEVSHGIPKMNGIQTKRLLNRLMDTSQGREDFGRESDRKLSDLKGRNERMKVTVDLLQLMHGSDLSVRCLQHNNNLSLYCLTERKILCVNCTYGDTKHRTHKVLPLRDSMHSIRKDN